MKDIRGWMALAVFCITCCLIGTQGFLLKKLNLTVIGMLVISIVIVLILDEFKKASEEKNDKKQKSTESKI